MICSSWPPTEKAQQKRKRAGQANSNIGNNVAISKSRVLKRMTKNDSVLHKHIKWLKELQEERRLHEEKKEIEQKAKLERKRLFMEREAKKRVAGSQLSDEPEPKHSPLLGREMDDLTVVSSIASIPMESKTKKPAWCRSEEMAEMEDEANLLDFVNGLDFDAYNEDLELQSLMSQLKARIKKLKHKKKKQEIKLQTCVDRENASLQAKLVDDEPAVDFLPGDVENDEVQADDTKSIANSVMSESSIGSVHSKKSLANLVAKARERRSDMALIEEDKEEAMQPPILSTVSDDNGARMAEKKSINKLAFINRNPAI